jgi:hypothetical protein
MLKYFLYVNNYKGRAVLHDRKCNKTKNLDLAIKEQQISRDAVWYGFKHKEDAIKKMQKTNCDKQLKHTCMYKH